MAEGAKVPRTHAALRRWKGPDGTLSTWADPLVDRPGTGKHPDLIKRYKAAIENIDLRLRKSKKARVGALEAEVAVLGGRTTRSECRMQASSGACRPSRNASRSSRICSFKLEERHP